MNLIGRLLHSAVTITVRSGLFEQLTNFLADISFLFIYSLEVIEIY